MSRSAAPPLAETWISFCVARLHAQSRSSLFFPRRQDGAALFAGSLARFPPRHPLLLSWHTMRRRNVKGSRPPPFSFFLGRQGVQSEGPERTWRTTRRCPLLPQARPGEAAAAVVVAVAAEGEEAEAAEGESTTPLRTRYSGRGRWVRRAARLPGPSGPRSRTPG